MPRRNAPSAAQVRGWTISTPTSQPASVPEVAEVEDAAPGELRYGFTLADLDRIARAAVAINLKWWSGSDRWQQVETAWSGIAEHLYAAEDPPTEGDLLTAARNAINDEVQGDRQALGLSHNGKPSPRFHAYWNQVPDEPWEDRLVDRIALKQILPLLTGKQQSAVLALAAMGDYRAAAEALGIGYGTLNNRLSVARKAFDEHWYAPEAPPTRRGRDGRVKSYSTPRLTHCNHCEDRHELTDENTYRSGGSRTCKAFSARLRAANRQRESRDDR